MSQAAPVMVIGDDGDFAYLLWRYVRESAHQIVFARASDDVLALARSQRPALIVLEVDLPGSRCWDLLRALKMDQATAPIPVLACSWLDEEQHSLEQGADVYLRKPILYEDFLAALTDLGLYSCP